MVNIDDFIKRLEKVLDYYALTASSFADKIGVQRSSLSHLLSGRNKPSLDFILKIIEEFPEIDLYWILNGKGSFPNVEETEVISKKNTELKNQTNLNSLFSDEHFSNAVVDEKKAESILNTEISIPTETSVEYIVVFYKNGTFKKYIAK